MNHFLEEFLKNNFNKINGFCSVETVFILDYLDTFESKKGGALEIGIHHGQFFIALNQLIDSSKYASYAIDIFDRQDLNIDKSGEGNYSQFLKNLEHHDVRNNGKNVTVIQGDSTDKSIFKDLHKCHYISIDGGHTPEHVINDLSIASDLVTNEGIVIVDDYFNHWWPSVTEGIIKYLMTNPVLVPFATSKNKMWMTKISYKPKYFNFIKHIPNFQKTETNFLNHKIIDLW